MLLQKVIWMLSGGRSDVSQDGMGRFAASAGSTGAITLLLVLSLLQWHPRPSASPKLHLLLSEMQKLQYSLPVLRRVPLSTGHGKPVIMLSQKLRTCTSYAGMSMEICDSENAGVAFLLGKIPVILVRARFRTVLSELDLVADPIWMLSNYNLIFVHSIESFKRLKHLKQRWNASASAYRHVKYLQPPSLFHKWQHKTVIASSQFEWLCPTPEIANINR